MNGGQPQGLVVTVQSGPCKSAEAVTVAEILGLRFPSQAEVRQAAFGLQAASRLVEADRVWQERQSRSARWAGKESAPVRSLIEVSPGSIRFRRTVPADPDDEDAGEQKGSGRQAIVGWTLKSRRQMVRSFAALDYAPMFDGNGIPARVTLTYPSDWVTVAPTRQAVQRHFRKFEKRFIRAWEEPVVALWKLEYQHRGAPHYHLLMRRPEGLAGEYRRLRHEAELATWEAAGLRELARQVALGVKWGEARKRAVAAAGPRPRYRRSVGDGLKFTQWLAVVWADIVNHPDPEERAAHQRAGTSVDVKDALKATDPKRASIYFSKHGVVKGSKEYQNKPPKEWVAVGVGPGRYWGYLGLSQLVVAAQVDGGQDYQLAKRTMRRWSSRARVWDPDARCYRYVKAMQVKAKPTGARPGRKVRRPVNRLAGASGSLCLNDAPAMAADLARLLRKVRDG